MTVLGVASSAPWPRRHGDENANWSLLRNYHGSGPGWAGTHLGVASKMLKISQKQRCRNYYSPEAEANSEGDSKYRGE